MISNCYEDHLCVLGTEMDLEYTLAASLFNQFQMGFWPLSKTIHVMLSAHEDGGGYFLGPVGSLSFHMDSGRLLHMGGVTIMVFPGGTPVSISCPIGKCRTKSIKVNLTNCHREVCRIKFYQIVTSDVLTSLWHFDKMLFQ